MSGVSVSAQIKTLNEHYQGVAKNPTKIGIEGLAHEILRISSLAKSQKDLSALSQLIDKVKALTPERVSTVKKLGSTRSSSRGSVKKPPKKEPGLVELESLFSALTYKAERGQLTVGEALAFQDQLTTTTSKTLNVAPFAALSARAEVLLSVAFALDPTPLSTKGSSRRRVYNPRTFMHEGQHYAIKFTRGQGSCALHALIGEEIGGVYRYKGDDKTSSARVKKHFTDALASELHKRTPIIENTFVDVVRSYLNEARKDGGDRCAHMLFTDTHNGRAIKGEWMRLQAHHHARIEELKNEEAALWKALITLDSPILTTIMEEAAAAARRGDQPSHDNIIGRSREASLAFLKANPRKLLNAVSPLQACTQHLREIESPLRAQIMRARVRQDRAQLGRERGEADFILQNRVVGHYITTVNKPAFYFNTHEINLGSHLFNRKVQVVASTREGIVPSEFLMNEGAPGDTIVIHHQGAHFSRCVKSDVIPAPMRPHLSSQRSGRRSPPKLGSAQEKRIAGQKILVDFYSGRVKNQNGVSIEDILKYSRGDLEKHHNFIQWLFPTRRVSDSVPESPLATDAFIRACKKNPAMQQNLVRSFQLMLSHYGLELSRDNVVQKGAHFEARKQRILGHNLRRVTRILTSLELLGRPDLAKSFYDCLEGLNNEGSLGSSFKTSFTNHWEPAMKKSGLLSKEPQLSPVVKLSPLEQQRSLRGSRLRRRSPISIQKERTSQRGRRSSPVVSSPKPLTIADGIQGLIEKGNRLLSKKDTLTLKEFNEFRHSHAALQKKAKGEEEKAFQTLGLFIETLSHFLPKKDIPTIQEKSQRSVQSKSMCWKGTAYAVSTLALGALGYGLSYLPSYFI